ncbi:hypothetical protein diail_8198 [Diaporthe ilicicola]|nr:hypothetical protein diail_8198 [Diaporthe ilicicola]
MHPSTLNMSLYDPSMFPALAPPPGVLPNFNNPATRAPAARIVICITLSVMILFVSLRIYTKIFVTRLFGVDDCKRFFLFIRSLPYIGCQRLNRQRILTHYGRAIYLMFSVLAISHTFSLIIGQNSFVAVLMYAVSSMFTKCTLLVFYLRLFQPDRRAKLMVWAGIITIFLFYVVSISFVLVICIPLSQDHSRLDPMKWSEGANNNSCERRSLTVSAAQGIFGAITDLYVLSIPISSVLALRLPKKRKIGVLAIFLTGLL